MKRIDEDKKREFDFLIGTKSKADRENSLKKYALSDDGLMIITQWRRNGLTQQEICDHLGINKITLYRWAKENETLSNALKMTKEFADTELEKKAYAMALEGNTTMMIFLLKNRMSSKYKDVQGVDMNMTAGAEVAKAFSDLVKRETE